jgi:hypothetical protein
MHKVRESFKIKIDELEYDFTDPAVTGGQLLNAAGKRPMDEFLIFQRLRNGQFEEIRLEESVDLTQPGLERFKTFKSGESYRLTVDGRRFEWGAPEVTGHRLKQFAGVNPADFEVWLEVRGGEGDVLIANHDSVRLDAPGVERFYTAMPNITVIINGRPRVVNKRSLSFIEIVKLAFPDAQAAPNTIYTIVYKNGPDENPQGSLVEGQTVIVKERMIINVTKTDKS